MNRREFIRRDGVATRRARPGKIPRIKKVTENDDARHDEAGHCAQSTVL